MRNIQTVLNNMIELSTNDKFIEQLNQVKYSASYRAPEFMFIDWNDAHSIMLEFYPIPVTNEEGLKIYSEFTTMTIEEVKLAMEVQ